MEKMYEYLGTSHYEENNIYGLRSVNKKIFQKVKDELKGTVIEKM